MLGDGVTAFIFAVGVSTWSYSKLMKNTNSYQPSLIGAAVVGIAAFIVLFTLLKYLLGW
jgi:tellurite resistance protein TehA-like permease